jgi:hypothetical protein
VEWNERGFINTDDALHRVIASQGFSHRTNRKAHFFIQPSLDAFDQFILPDVDSAALRVSVDATDTWVASFLVPGNDSLRLPGLGIVL